MLLLLLLLLYLLPLQSLLKLLLLLLPLLCSGLDEDDRIIQMKDTGGAGEVSGDTGNDSILARMKDRNMRDLVYLINKPPRWNEQVGAYVLNFNGRVTMASVKNFQLVDPDEQNAVVLQVSSWFILFMLFLFCYCYSVYSDIYLL